MPERLESPTPAAAAGPKRLDVQEAVFSAHSCDTLRESESYCQPKETVRTPEARGRSEIRTEGMITPIRSDVTHGRPCGAKRTRSLVHRPRKRR